MPAKFRPEFLVELTMRDSKLEKLWEGTPPLRSLKYMDLSASTNMKDIPNISRATNLEKLYLRFCENLVTIPCSSLQNLNKLKVLDMSSCIKLKTLPTNINLESLSVLNLRGCSELKSFPFISTQIQFMSLGETAIQKVPSLIKLCSRLVSLEMAGCKNLKTLPSFPASIEIVDISWTGVELIYIEHLHMPYVIEHMNTPYVCVFGNRCYKVPILSCSTGTLG